MYQVSHSYLFQQFHLFKSVANSLVFSNFTVVSRSTDPTYSKVSQIHLSYLIPQSDLNSTVPHIKQYQKFNSLISFYILILYQQFYLFNIVTNSVVSIVLSRFTFSSISTVALIQYCHKFSCISILHSYLLQQPKHIQKFHKFTCLIQFHSLISLNGPTY